MSHCIKVQGQIQEKEKGGGGGGGGGGGPKWKFVVRYTLTDYFGEPKGWRDGRGEGGGGGGGGAGGREGGFLIFAIQYLNIRIIGS